MITMDYTTQILGTGKFLNVEGSTCSNEVSVHFDLLRLKRWLEINRYTPKDFDINHLLTNIQKWYFYEDALKRDPYNEEARDNFIIFLKNISFNEDFLERMVELKRVMDFFDNRATAIKILETGNVLRI